MMHVHGVANQFALADRIEARRVAAQRQVDALTPSLLARAFAGKLVPQAPNSFPKLCEDPLTLRANTQRRSGASGQRRRLPRPSP
jgi:type I restriction enzyme S subunit